MPYILEVQKFEPDDSKVIKKWNGKAEHVGYINKVFKNKKEACEYYDINNSHMRKLNTYGSYRSDLDPDTYLLYVVRESYYEYKKIQPPW